MLRVKISFNKELNVYNVNFIGKLTAEHEGQLFKVLEDYELQGLTLHPKIRPKLKPGRERRCRYCQKVYPEVTFRKSAHVVPECMGNKNLICDDECDSCNQRFAKYEDALCKFLGVARSLGNNRGKDGVPTFKSTDKKFEVRANRQTKGLAISFGNNAEDHFDLDESGQRITVKSVRLPYKPIYVYKCLLKIAMALVPEDELLNYDSSRRFLISDKYDQKSKHHPYLRLFGYFLPGPAFNKPIIFLWKKKKGKESKPIPSCTMVVYFHNYAYQIFLPFSVRDKEINQIGQVVTFNLIPPFLDENWISHFGTPGSVNIDLSDSEVKKDDKLNVTIKFDKAIFKDLPK